MSSKKLGYTWYPKDWRSSRRVFRLTLAERGFYRELIDMAMASDNKTVLETDIWAREFGCSEQEILDFIEKFQKLTDENGDPLAKIKGVIIFIPSCENRLNLIRGGKKGGETNKPVVKPSAKPIVKPLSEPSANQREIEIEKEKEKYKKEIQRDDVFENSVLKFFGFSEFPHHHKQQSLLSQFCCAKILSGEYEYFKTQFKDYSNYIVKANKQQYVQSLYTFLGNQEKAFDDGKWSSENWAHKLGATVPQQTQTPRRVIDHSKS